MERYKSSCSNVFSYIGHFFKFSAFWLGFIQTAIFVNILSGDV